MISALIVAKDEEIFIKGCIDRILPYIEEVIFVDNASTDKTREIVENLKNDKIKIYDYPPTENQGELRQFSLDQATQEWIWQIDADEWYEPDACKAIVDAVNAPGRAISFRVGYFQCSWRYSHAQANFEHYPDRLYRRDVVDRYDGILPNDMTKVKREFYKCRPFLEYDNPDDKSFENTCQPILPVKYYHLARTRGYNYEYQKWYRYNRNIHPDWNEEKLAEQSRVNGWVSGLYSIEKIEVPFEIPPIKNPKVSVVIPCFNYEQYVGLAIQSVLDQTHGAYEIIVVDDGSHDRSREIISRFPVKLICQPNYGVACARNEGAKNATGDYIIFLDADDELDRFYIEKTLKETQGDTQIVYTDMLMFGDMEILVAQPDYSLEEMRKWQVVPSTCALIDRRIWELVGGFDNTEIHEDWGFFLRIAIAGFNFKHIKEPLFKYRKHGVSRIEELDSKMVESYAQLKERYQITKEVDLPRIKECQKICG